MVSAMSVVSSLASRISERSRHGSRPPTLLAIGHTCLYQAIKAIAQARQYVLHPGDRTVPVFDLTCQPAFRENVGRDRVRKPSLALYLNRDFELGTPSRSRSPSNSSPPNQQIAELSISSSGEPPHIAGALAARVREGADVVMTAIGGEAAAVAIRAVCHARGYLAEDRLDVKCQPEFITIVKGDNQLSAIRFNVIPERT